MVSKATCTAVSASISTPVGPTVSTVAVQRTWLGWSPWAGWVLNSTATRVRARGWHSGMRSLVFLAAWMPAMRAMPNTSPFLAVPDSIKASVLGSMSMRPLATPTRWVLALAATSTMWAWPWLSKWVNELVRAERNVQGIRASYGHGKRLDSSVPACGSPGAVAGGSATGPAGPGAGAPARIGRWRGDEPQRRAASGGPDCALAVPR